MSQGLFDKTTNALGAAVNFRQLRQSVISSNIANAQTPGYKAKEVDFEEALKRAIELEGRGEADQRDGDEFPLAEGAISRVEPDVYDNPDVDTRNDGNTVDMEKQMAHLAENTILYKAAVELISKKLGAMRYVVTEGSR